MDEVWAARRAHLQRIIFEADTPAGRRFDLWLIVMVLASVAVVVLDSIQTVGDLLGPGFTVLEWTFTVLFTVEYALRLWCAADRLRYATSFFGIIDLVAVLPTYLGLFYPGANYLLAVRVFRVLRVFRLAKLVRLSAQADLLLRAALASRRKVAVFLVFVGTVVVTFGSLMYLIEGPERGFTSIPKSMYWAVVTLTTVGYGDITPQTPLGQALSALVMILGYAVIAVPTGIFATELAVEMQRTTGSWACVECGRTGHQYDAAYCAGCGSGLPARPAPRSET